MITITTIVFITLRQLISLLLESQAKVQHKLYGRRASFWVHCGICLLSSLAVVVVLTDWCLIAEKKTDQRRRVIGK
jgi:hypothetical protein